MELSGYAEIPTAPAPRASLVLITTSPQATDPNSGPTLAGRLIPGGTITSATLELRLEPHSR